MKKTIYAREYHSLLEKLKKARLDSGLTQAQAAQKLGKPQSFLSKCENGERRVDAIELRHFAKLYGKNPDFFLY